ncbi:MAG: three-Cys-motif partner protein TcmP [Chloroflexota bacterium]
MTNNFFNEMREQSVVKATIVSKYFWRWAGIIISTAKKNEQNYGRKQGKIAYIDLFAGPGRYKEGSDSTPLLILRGAIQNQDTRERLVTIFNDKDEENIQSLENAIKSLPGIETLKTEPVIMNQEVGENIVKIFEGMKLIPTLFFVDPFGYKGLSLRLINSVLQNWGCDCIFFFNYNRISMGISNEFVTEHMEALFGKENVEIMRQSLEAVTPNERELFIIETLAQSLKAMGGEYVLPFRFRNENNTRTSHHLIFVSKHFRGYEEMKEVMAKESSTANQGVASFEYSPATERQPLLFGLSTPLDDLGELLLTTFAGKTLSMQEIYERHNVDTPFIKKNYKVILQQLETDGKIIASKHKKGTFGDGVMVTFP